MSDITPDDAPVSTEGRLEVRIDDVKLHQYNLCTYTLRIYRYIALVLVLCSYYYSKPVCIVLKFRNYFTVELPLSSLLLFAFEKV